jgi:hypothetical protein
MATQFESELERLLQGINEPLEARSGICPQARVCTSKLELATWFRSLGNAAGVIAANRG